MKSGSAVQGEMGEPSQRAMNPVVVLVHGTRMSRVQWTIYPSLLPEVDLVMVDLPGHGARVDEEFTAEAALATIDDAVAGAGRPVVLVGHSLGGFLSMMWAAQHPDSLAALVVIGASADPRGRLTGVYRGFARILPHVGAERMARVANAVIRLLGGGRSEAGAPLPGGEAYAALPAAWEVVIQHARPELLCGVRCPVVLVNGQFDQMRVHALRYAQACADPTVVQVARASHLLPLSHPEAVVEVLRGVVARAREDGPVGHRS